MKILTAIPIYNEERTIVPVLDEVRKYAQDILVVNDGSTDNTFRILAGQLDLHVIHHKTNRGYGAGLRSAFGFACAHHYDIVCTMDCDGQHEPSRLPVLVEALSDEVDLVSGSRYLRTFHQDTLPPPADRRRINHLITTDLNQRFGWNLTDTFCGFKAYRVCRLRELDLDEDGWGMPLQLWVQAAQLGWRISEIAVPLLYVDPNRHFGGILDNADERLKYYHEIIERELAKDRLSACCRGEAD